MNSPALRNRRPKAPRHTTDQPSSAPLAQTKHLAAYYAACRSELTQIFEIDANIDNTIEACGDMIFRIPANAFMDEHGKPVNGRVQVSVIEISKQADMVTTDRTTTSGGELLESGGAFSFDASQGGRPLILRKPARASLPVSPMVRTAELMQGYRGLAMGEFFNWVSSPDSGLKIESTAMGPAFEVKIPQPGWINCDHVMRLAMQPRYEISLPIEHELEELDVFFLYRTINSTAKLQGSALGTYSLPGRVPLPAIAYALGSQYGTFHQGFHLFDHDPRFITSEHDASPLDIEFDLRPVEKSAIKTNLERKIKEWDTRITGRPLQESFARAR